MLKKLLSIGLLSYLLVVAPCFSIPVRAQCYRPGAAGKAASDDITKNAVPANRNDPNEAFLLDEAAVLNSKMGLNAKIYIIPVNNAFATRADRNVYFGRPFIGDLERDLKSRLKNDGDLKNYRGALRAGLRFVLAHEFAHLYQFAAWDKGVGSYPGTSPPMETQADCLAGLWIGFDMSKTGADIFGVMTALEAATIIGDEQWTSKDHHGSPFTRRLCAGAGLRRGQVLSFGPLDKAYSEKRAEIYRWSADEAMGILKKDKDQRTF
jgi:hypothetical protein